MLIKAPLAIHIIAHNEYENKNLYEENIYSTFNRNIINYLERGINIPVFSSNPNQLQQEIVNYEKNVVILFVDDTMLLDSEYTIDSIVDNSTYCIIPVSISSNAYKKHDYIAKHSFLRAYDYTDIALQVDYVLFELVHEIYKYIVDTESLTIFLSHAKLDGEDIAKSFKKHIDSDTKLKNFFDVNDIQNLTDWAQIIESGVESSILLAIQTDKYSSREWCRREILVAKKHNVPLITVNCLEQFEDRSFPYIGNIPTITIENSTEGYNIALYQLMLESLRFSYQDEFIKYFMKLFFEKTNYISLPNTPELLTLAYHDNDTNTFIYPDPPLGQEELDLLHMYNEKYQFETPLTFITSKIDFSSINIAISVSETENNDINSLSDIHLKDFIIELTRYLLSTQSTLLYGGNINYGGYMNFAKIIADLARTYQNVYDEYIAIENYVSYPYSQSIDTQLKADLLKIVEFIPIEPDDELEHKDESYITSETLTKMRHRMNGKLNMRIVAGGKTEGFSGKYPGILEEVYLALLEKKPVFLVGAFGGATQKIIECINNDIPEEFKIEYQFKNEKFKSLYDIYQQENNTIDYEVIVSFLNSCNIDDFNNGLSAKENELLFKSQNIYEIIYLILKGISSIEGGINGK